MGFSMGPARPMAQGKPVGMLPRGFMIGGMRQGATIDTKDFMDADGVIDIDAYKRALAEEKAREEAFFNGVEQDRQAMMPPWMR
jgi:hypothetical protein